jgi:hypothetical protein
VAQPFARQCPAEQLVDEVQLHVVRVLLGGRDSPFDRFEDSWRLT